MRGVAIYILILLPGILWYAGLRLFKRKHRKRRKNVMAFEDARYKALVVQRPSKPTELHYSISLKGIQRATEQAEKDGKPHYDYQLVDGCWRLVDKHR